MDEKNKELAERVDIQHQAAQERASKETRAKMGAVPPKPASSFMGMEENANQKLEEALKERFFDAGTGTFNPTPEIEHGIRGGMAPAQPLLSDPAPKSNSKGNEPSNTPAPSIKEHHNFDDNKLSFETASSANTLDDATRIASTGILDSMEQSDSGHKTSQVASAKSPTQSTSIV